VASIALLIVPLPTSLLDVLTARVREGRYCGMGENLVAY
jgi:hypothetical protein